MAFPYVRCLFLRSTIAATAPRSAVAELGVVSRTRAFCLLIHHMSISLSELAGCYVVLWSPRHRIYQTEKFSVMLDRNHTFFFRQARSVPDWIVVGVAGSAAEADKIGRRADHELSERRDPTPPTQEEQDALDADLDALDAGTPLPRKPAKQPWWISEK